MGVSYLHPEDQSSARYQEVGSCFALEREGGIHSEASQSWAVDQGSLEVGFAHQYPASEEVEGCQETVEEIRRHQASVEETAFGPEEETCQEDLQGEESRTAVGAGAGPVELSTQM
jgi:hypothetical protein